MEKAKAKEGFRIEYPNTPAGKKDWSKHFSDNAYYAGKHWAQRKKDVDHFIAKKAWAESGTDDLSNLMPSCRMCNHYKRANSLEVFRMYIREIPYKLRQNYIYKVGVVYGNIIENVKPIEFYFEKAGRADDAD